MYCRAVLVKHVGVDDWLIVAAAVFAVALFIHNALNTFWGSGYDFDGNCKCLC